MKTTTSNIAKSTCREQDWVKISTNNQQATTDLPNPLLRCTTCSQILPSQGLETHRHRRKPLVELGEEMEACLPPSSNINRGRGLRLPDRRWSSSPGRRAQRGEVSRAVVYMVQISGRWQNFPHRLIVAARVLAPSPILHERGTQLFTFSSAPSLAWWKRRNRAASACREKYALRNTRQNFEMGRATNRPFFWLAGCNKRREQLIMPPLVPGSERFLCCSKICVVQNCNGFLFGKFVNDPKSTFYTFYL
jgi:hypothetical protein